MPIQTVGGVARWEGDKLTFWGMGQGIYPQRAEIARALGIDVSNVRYINKAQRLHVRLRHAGIAAQPVHRLHRENGGPAGEADAAKGSGAGADQHQAREQDDLAGARKDGRIVALLHEIHLNGGDSDAPGHSQLEISKNQCELYTSRIPHWRSAWFTWKTNAPGSSRFGATRSRK